MRLWVVARVPSLAGLDSSRFSFPALTCRAFLFRRCAAEALWVLRERRIVPDAQ